MRIFNNRFYSEDTPYAHNDLIDFKVETLANRLFAEWAINHFYEFVESEAYIEAALKLGRSDPEHLIERIYEDLNIQSYTYSIRYIRKQHQKFHIKAREQILNLGMVAA